MPHPPTLTPHALTAAVRPAACILAIALLAVVAPSAAASSPARGGTGAAAPSLLDCPVPQPAKASPKPNAKLLAKLIRCLFEKKAEPGMDGAVRIDIQALRIGKPRAFVVAADGSGDLGNGGPGTVVWPVRATWRWTAYYSASRQVSDNVSMFNCLLSTFGEWECGLAQRIKDGPLRSLPAT